MNPELLSLTAFAVTTGGVLVAVACCGRTDRRARDRLDGLERGKSRLRRAGTAPDNVTAASRFVHSALAKLVSRLLPDDEHQRTGLQARLMHGGIYASNALAVYQAAKSALAIAPALIGIAAGYLGFLEMRHALLAGAATGVVGMILPGLWLDRMKRRRQCVLNRALPDALDLMVTCVEGGLSLEGSLQRVGEELRIAHPVLAGEMAVVQRQMEFGASPDAALGNFAERTDLESLQTLCALVQQARRFGTGISDALRTHARMLRFQREALAEELAQKAAVKILFPTLLFIFPAIFVVLAGPAAIRVTAMFDPQQAVLSK